MLPLFRGTAPALQDNWTLGVNVYLEKAVRGQLNYTWKKTRKSDEPDLGDNILLVNVQFSF